MEFKNVFSVLAIALLLMQASYAQTLEEIFLEDISPWVYLLLAIAALIIAAAYLLGKFTEHSEFIVFAKTELWQLLLTIAIFLSYAGMLAATATMFSSMIQGAPDVNEYVLQKLLAQEQNLKLALSQSSTKQFEYFTKGAGVTSNIAPFFRPEAFRQIGDQAVWCAVTVLNYFNCLAESILNIGLGVFEGMIITIKLANYYHYKVFGRMLEQSVSQYVTLAEMFLIPLRVMFSFVFAQLLPLLPVMAVFLRIIPFTREAGNVLFTISIAFGIVFPFLIAYFYQAYESFNPVSSLCSSSYSYFVFGPYTECDMVYSIPRLVSYFPLVILGPSLAFAVALTFATNFNKIFDYFKG